ncbi:MAG TPA: FAD-dependent oxidoreductase, partial [Planctomycetaceae bacterium]|nr:FAD-dependent oxidoreductase [Planctomycetaceae bacterium]
KIRDYYSKWGNCKDEFKDNAGWPHQLYVREARRMVGEYVVTQHDCQGVRKTERSIAMAAYTMDSHNVQRYVDASGQVRNEGDVQVGGFPPYPIDFGTILPKQHECTNMLVPVCLSASHIAYGSIRMEPVFMVLGQSAATVACQAIDAESPVQDVDYAALRKRLIQDKQRL